MLKQTEKLANDLISNIQSAAIKTAMNQNSSFVNYFIGTVSNIDETNGRALVRYMTTQQDGTTGYSNIEVAVKTEESIAVGDLVIVFYLGNLTDSFLFGKMTSTYNSRIIDGGDSLQSRLEKGQIVVGKALGDSQGNVIKDFYQPKLTFDTTPTASSDNPVTSNGINVSLINLQNNFDEKLKLYEKKITKIGAKNGYLTLDGGITLQWGEVRSSNTREHEVTFPLAYTTLYTVVATYYNNSNDNTKEWNIRYENNTGFSIKKNSNEGAQSGCNWIAIGII